MVVNGRLTGAQTVALKSADGHRLRADAAASWDRLASAYRARTGGRALPVTDSYRPLSVQERIFKDRYIRAASGGGHYGDVRWWNGARYVRRRGTNAAAVPGTSNHGWGLAVDAGVTSFTSQAYKDLAAIAGRYGWSNAAGRAIGEPWHWEYDPAADRSATPRPIPGSSAYAMDRLDLRDAHNTPVQGRHVDNLQGLLLAAGFGPDGLVDPRTGRPDGVAGAGTREALGAAQVKFNTGDGKGNPDYVVGDGTWLALIEY